jgi:hypothetical protein
MRRRTSPAVLVAHRHKASAAASGCGAAPRAARACVHTRARRARGARRCADRSVGRGPTCICSRACNRWMVSSSSAASAAAHAPIAPRPAAVAVAAPRGSIAACRGQAAGPAAAAPLQPALLIKGLSRRTRAVRARSGHSGRAGLVLGRKGACRWNEGSATASIIASQMIGAVAEPSQPASPPNRAGAQ